MSVSDPRLCPECGSDTWFAQEFPRVRDQWYAAREEMKRQAARFAIERAEWELKEIERSEEHKFLQSKAHKQRLIINRLEKKLRAMKVQPHA